MAGSFAAGTVSATLVRLVTRAMGVEMDALAARAGLTADSLHGGAIRYEDTVRLWDALSRQLDDPVVGHHQGSRMRLHQVGVFGPMLAHADDLRAGLRNLTDAFGVALSDGALAAGETDAGWELEYRRPPSSDASIPGGRHGVESLFATIVSLTRQATDLGFAVPRVELDTPRPPDPRDFEAFYGGTVRFERPVNRFVLPTSLLSTPMVGRDPAIASILSAHAPRLLRSESFEERVALTCAEALRAGDASAAAVARRLGVSRRTLHRRLKETGVLYRDVVDRVAHDRAVVLLGDASLSIDEVASAVGYASRAAFDRAFRRWRGQSPAQARAELTRD